MRFGPFIRGMNTRDKEQRIGSESLRKLRNAYILDDITIRARDGSSKFGEIGTKQIDLVMQFEDRAGILYDFVLTEGKLKIRDETGAFVDQKGADGFDPEGIFTHAKLANTIYVADGSGHVRLVTFDRPKEIYVTDKSSDEVVVLGANDLSLRRRIDLTPFTISLIDANSVAVDATRYYVLNTRATNFEEIFVVKKSDDSLVTTITSGQLTNTQGGLGDIDVGNDGGLYFLGGSVPGGVIPIVQHLNKVTGATIAQSSLRDTGGGSGNIRDPIGLAVGKTFFYATTRNVGGTVLAVSKYRLSDLGAATINALEEITFTTVAGGFIAQPDLDLNYLYAAFFDVAAADRNKLMVYRSSPSVKRAVIGLPSVPTGCEFLSGQ